MTTSSQSVEERSARYSLCIENAILSALAGYGSTVPLPKGLASHPLKLTCAFVAWIALLYSVQGGGSSNIPQRISLSSI